MKKKKVSLIAFAVIIGFAACSGSKKSTASSNTGTSNNTANNNTTTVNNEPVVMVKPATGINPPTEADLSAIKVKFSDVTMEKLNEGHLLYTEGACIKCHGAKNIYKRPEAEWKHIIDNMSEKARISDSQKDAVYKYVLAMKATQPK